MHTRPTNKIVLKFYFSAIQTLTYPHPYGNIRILDTLFFYFLFFYAFDTLDLNAIKNHQIRLIKPNQTSLSNQTSLPNQTKLAQL